MIKFEKLRTILRTRYISKIQNLFDQLLEQDRIQLLDVGAQGGIEPRWKSVEKNLEYLGLEGDLSEFKKINQNLLSRESKTSYRVVGNEPGKKIFYISREPGKSSLYKPNKNFLNKFDAWARFETIEKIEVEVHQIDKITNQKPDFVKLDIQGGELNALKGAQNVLDNCLGVEIEVEFAELYENQPIFSEVNDFMDKLGFEIIDFVNLRKWNRTEGITGGQLVFGDALYLKKDTEKLLFEESQSSLFKLIAILILYGKFDYARSLLEKSKHEKAFQLLSNNSDFKKIERMQFRVSKINFYISRILGLFVPNLNVYTLN